MKTKYEKQLNDFANKCTNEEVTARELFRAFDVNGDGTITKEDLKQLAKSDGENKHFSKNDLKNVYARIGKQICRNLCDVMDENSGEECVTIDELFQILDKNGDGKVKLGDFLRIAKKDGDFMGITREELEQEFAGAWKNPEEQKNFFEKLFS